ncbi:glycosyltransferase family 2 protein [Lachnoclostridium phytofermentans]|uniref:glycosyltransferase family 2 protein n=1 Tax=Lachnoclostridium phytofermentans TaxID=66219 RepID=UPI0004961911|nr:glycosyltransferase [Lachnoclostridium phytofermentans]
MVDISVIIPVYNVEAYIEKCLDSLVKQTIWEQMELILVDDGSRDHSKEICMGYANKYSNIKVLHQKNSGVSAARNRGIDAATGIYIAFMDADDYAETDLYEILYHVATRNRADLSIVDFSILDTNGKLYKKRSTENSLRWNRFEALEAFLSGGEIGINIFDKLFLREKVKDLYFPVGRAIGEDMYYIFESLFRCDLVCGHMVSKYIYVKRKGSAMLSSFSEKYFDTLYLSEEILKKINISYPQLVEKAKAHYMHENCKTLERMYLSKNYILYKERERELRKELKAYPLSCAKKELSRKQYLGIALMKFSPFCYIKAVKLLKIS